MSNWFLLFWGRAKAVLLLTHFCVFQRNKRQKSRAGFQLLDPGASKRMPGAVVRYLLNLSARTHWSVRKRVGGTYILHLRVLCRCFSREQEQGPDGIAMETELILFIYLLTYFCMHIFKPWLPLMAYLGSHPVSGDFVNWKLGNVKCWLLVSNSKVQQFCRKHSQSAVWKWRALLL